MLCGKILSLHAPSFLDSEVCPGPASREGLSTSGQGSLPPHPVTLGLWVLPHVDWITTSAVGCIPQKMASFCTRWEVPTMRVAPLHTHNDNFSDWLILSPNCATLPTATALLLDFPPHPWGLISMPMLFAPPWVAGVLYNPPFPFPGGILQSLPIAPMILWAGAMAPQSPLLISTWGTKCPSRCQDTDGATRPPDPSPL